VSITVQGGKKMKTYMAKAEEVQRKWYVIDADGQVLGRLASQVASILRGKHKPTFTPHVDTGDFVIIVNAEKIVLTGDKLDKKFYRHHSLHPGGLKEIPYRKLMATKPELAIEEAVKRMLPKGTLGRDMYRKLKVYRGPEHNNEAQKPEVLVLKY
jgi:large subunit ribosomal protein L13